MNMAEIDPGRLALAVHLDCRRIAPDRYLVSGGAGDQVLVIDGGWVRCDCSDYPIRGDGCKHCLCVRLHSGDPQVVAALRMLVPRPSRSVRAA